MDVFMCMVVGTSLFATSTLACCFMKRHQESMLRIDRRLQWIEQNLVTPNTGATAVLFRPVPLAPQQPPPPSAPPSQNTEDPHV